MHARNSRLLHHVVDDVVECGDGSIHAVFGERDTGLDVGRSSVEKPRSESLIKIGYSDPEFIDRSVTNSYPYRQPPAAPTRHIST
jgi:hypothetical protein